MTRGTYLHTSKGRDICYDGVTQGSATALFAREHRELGDRARLSIRDENEGDRLDRFLVIVGRIR